MANDASTIQRAREMQKTTKLFILFASKRFFFAVFAKQCQLPLFSIVLDD